MIPQLSDLEGEIFMPQSRTQSILGATPYRNPRHEQEAAALEEHEKSLRESQGQGKDDTDTEVKPEHNWEKRYKDLQSYTAKKIKGLEDTIEDLRKQSVPKVEAPKTAEELEAFKGQNPEMFAIIQSMAQNMFNQHIAKYDQQMAEMQGTLNQSSIERAKLQLKEAHPDYESIMESNAFHDWAATQTPDVQDWIYKNPDNATLAIKAVSLFKYESGWGKDTNKATNTPQSQGTDHLVNSRNTKVDPGAVNRDHPAYIWKESEIGKMRPDEFAKWEPEISLAQREGRLLIGQ